MCGRTPQAQVGNQFPLRWDTDLGGMHMLALNQDKDAWGKDLQESVVTLSRTAKVGPRAVPSFSIGNMKHCRRCKRLGFDPWVGKISGEGNGNPLQYSSQESPMHRGAWQTTVHGVAESQT